MKIVKMSIGVRSVAIITGIIGLFLQYLGHMKDSNDCLMKHRATFCDMNNPILHTHIKTHTCNADK